MNEYREDLVKLMRPDGTTYDGMLWGDGVTNTATDDVIHVYRTKEQAAFIAAAHGVSDFDLARRASGVIFSEDGTKVGCKTLTTHELIELPKPTPLQCVYAAIRCTQDDDPKRSKLPASWHKWADGWIDGTDRSRKAAVWALASAREYAARVVWAIALAEAADATNAAWAALAAAWAIQSAAHGGVFFQPILEEALAWRE